MRNRKIIVLFIVIISFFSLVNKSFGQNAKVDTIKNELTTIQNLSDAQVQTIIKTWKPGNDMASKLDVFIEVYKGVKKGIPFNELYGHSGGIEGFKKRFDFFPSENNLLKIIMVIDAIQVSNGLESQLPID